jgi:hypothetical protein
MAAKQLSAPRKGEEPVEVFRQFAWHLAGSLATANSGGSGRSAPRPAKSGTKR